MQKLKHIFRQWLPIFFILLLSIVATINNLGFEKHFLGDDSGVSYHFPNMLKQLTFYMWDAYHAPGKMNLSSSFSLVWNVSILILFRLGFTSLAIERITFFLFLFVSGTGMYMAIRSLFTIIIHEKKHKFLLVASSIGAFYYMFNHYTMALMSIPIFPYHLSYMLLPWLFYAFILNFFSPNTIYKTIFFTFIYLFLAAGNPSNTISISLFLVFFFYWFRKDISNIKKRFLYFVIPFFFLTTILTAYIWIPILEQKANPYGTVGEASDFLASIQLHSTYTSIPNILMLAGSVTWESFPYFKIYTQFPPFIFIGYLPLFLALISFFSSRNKKIIFFFLTVLLLSIFFAKGLHPPFRNLFLFIFTKIPLYGMFRAVYPKFAFYGVFAVSVLMSYGINMLLSTWQKKLAYVIIGLIILYNIPFFQGQIPQSELLTHIPNTYQKAEQTERLDKNFRMLSFPTTPNGSGPLFKWGTDYYVGPPTDTYIFNQEVMESFWFISEGYRNLKPKDSWIISSLEKDFRYFIPLLKIINVKSLILHKDAPEYYKFMPSLKSVQIHGVGKATALYDNLSNIKGLHVISTNPYYDIYEIESDLTLSKFYIPEIIVKNKNQIESLEKIITSEMKKKKFAVLPLNDFVQSEDITSAQLQTKKINQTLYSVEVHNPERKSFFLIFSESYNSSWQAYVGKKEIAFAGVENESAFLANLSIYFHYLRGDIKLLDNSFHMTANSYANAWFINGTKLPKDATIFISFKPQIHFVFGLLVSATCFVVLLFILTVKGIKKYVNYS